MGVAGLFSDRKRERIRRKTGVGLVEDYLLRSEVTDYYRLRLVVNSLVGLVICSCIYYLGWKRLNFADFSPLYGILFKWFMILSIVFAYTISPLFRCAIFCVLLGAMGKNGQAPLTMLVFENLNEGPLNNIIQNYRMAAEIIICHLELQAKIASNRVAMFTGPLEEMLETQLKRGLRALKKAVTFVRKLIAPFRGEISGKNTDEDERLDDEQHQLAILSQRRELGATDEESDQNIGNLTVKKPAWTEFKTKIGRKIAARMSSRCNDIFTKGVDKCRQLFASIQTKCYDTLPTVVNWFVCSNLNMEHTCQDMDRRRQSLSICSAHLRDSQMGSSMEGELSDVANMTDQLEREATVNLHMVLVDSPRLESDYSLSDIKVKVKHGAQYVKALMKSTKQLVQGLFIFFVYRIFRDAVNMIANYRNDVQFNNHFISPIFWQIDGYRERNGQTALLRIDSVEMKRWKLMKIFSWPTKAELRKAKRPFYNWLLLTLVVTTLVVIDYYIYDFLNQIVTSSETRVREAGESAEVEVLGDGVVAEFVNKMIHVNQTVEVDDTLSNDHCLTAPNKPDIVATAKWLILPLVVSLLMQVMFSFIVKRVVLNYFLPFMFPLRDRVRIIFLYNKLLFLRSTQRHDARSRIRFVATRWKINHDNDEGGWFSTRSWFKLQVLDRIFRTGQCLMCELYMRPTSLWFCSTCPASYCKYCLKEMDDDCYACQADRGEVTSENSQKEETTSTQVTTTAKVSKGSRFIDSVEKATSVEKIN